MNEVNPIREHFTHQLTGSNKYIICSQSDKITEQIIESRLIDSLESHTLQTRLCVSKTLFEMDVLPKRRSIFA